MASAVYLNNDNEEHAAIKYVRKSRQGLYLSVLFSFSFFLLFFLFFSLLDGARTATTLCLRR